MEMIGKYIFCSVIFVCLMCGIDNLRFVSKENDKPHIQLKISNGTIQGRKALTYENFLPYFIFQGIPYAQPPIKNLRFRPPQSPKNWTGILDATREQSKCTQFFGRLEDIINFGSEDCLYINVYTPEDPENINTKILLPVMVWIYGGGFLGGDSDYSTYGPDYLLEQGVVVVTFNYRLGVFGFLSTEDLESPGNYGLKDQVAALKWVQNNIKYFGGDPKQVTIFGQSAGAASVQYLLQSPLTEGLIHRAISESGSSLCPWAFQRNPRRIAFEIGLMSGIVTTNSEELVKGLRNVDMSALTWTQVGAGLFNLINPLNGLPFSPTIEPEHDGAFITQKSYEMLKSGNFSKIPYITGLNSQESAMFDTIVSISRPVLAQLDVTPQVLVQDDMNIPTFSPTRLTVGIAIKNYYFKNQPLLIVNKNQVLNYISDAEFLRPIQESVKLMSKHAPIFFYHFSYEGYLGVVGNERNDRTEKGVAHSEDLWYIWHKRNLTSESEMDHIVRKRMLKLWTNFARTGNPTPQTEDYLLDNIKWPAISKDDVICLDINANLTLRKNLRNDAMKFWKNLYDKFGNPPYDTY